MIEVRFFATLREGRGKEGKISPENIRIAGDVLRLFHIDQAEVAILLINGFHSRAEDPVRDGDLISLFPPVGGG